MENSCLLTTFITPKSCYCFNKLSFGICSAPKHIQKRMLQILSRLEEFSAKWTTPSFSAQSEHNKRLTAALECIQAAGATPNPEKCKFGKPELKFLGHLVNEGGIHADPTKTSAICEMAPPTNVSELRRFTGMVHQLGKFSPNPTDQHSHFVNYSAKTKCGCGVLARSKYF